MARASCSAAVMPPTAWRQAWRRAAPPADADAPPADADAPPADAELEAVLTRNLQDEFNNKVFSGFDLAADHTAQDYTLFHIDVRYERDAFTAVERMNFSRDLNDVLYRSPRPSPAFFTLAVVARATFHGRVTPVQVQQGFATTNSMRRGQLRAWDSSHPGRRTSSGLDPTGSRRRSRLYAAPWCHVRCRDTWRRRRRRRFVLLPKTF